MAEIRTQRRLAAILAADVVGYSALMERDEAGTLAALKARRQDVLAPVVARHHGRVVKVMGDGVLVEFGSAVDAVQCAVELQKGFTGANQGVPGESQIVLRIGINLGDVIVEGSDIYGDGVNVAARLEGQAEPGGICISASVRDQVTGKLALEFDDLGERTLKNIVKPVRVYRVGTGGTIETAAQPALTLPDRPSIAVLPFQNMSGDPEQEYFADGMVEEIITALSRMKGLFVIARNSSFAYKGRPVDVKQVGRELGVRYVLEGSVRKVANRVRITGQLIDTATGAHLWAERFDGGLEDIFDLQDQVTVSVVGAIAPKLEKAEMERSRRKPLNSLDAYDHYLRGLAAAYQWTKEANEKALSHSYRAIELDPEFASAYGLAAFCYQMGLEIGWVTDRAEVTAEVARLARRAAELGVDDAFALSAAASCLAFILGDLDTAAALNDHALALNPNLAFVWGTSGWLKVQLGDPETAIEHLARGMRLSPFDPYMFDMQAATAFAHYYAGRFIVALSSAEAAVRARPNYGPALKVLAASAAMAGCQEVAQRAIASLLELQPAMRISNTTEYLCPRRPEHLASWQEGLRKAGLPE